MSKDQFLKRCEAYRDSQDDMKPVWKDTFLVMRMALDFTMSMQAWRNERALDEMDAINEISRWRMQASFRELYSALCFSYRLCHPCSKCAEDKESWETRYWFCDHK